MFGAQRGRGGASGVVLTHHQRRFTLDLTDLRLLGFGVCQRHGKRIREQVWHIGRNMRSVILRSGTVLGFGAGDGFVEKFKSLLLGGKRALLAVRLSRDGFRIEAHPVESRRKFGQSAARLYLVGALCFAPRLERGLRCGVRRVCAARGRARRFARGRCDPECFVQPSRNHSGCLTAEQGRPLISQVLVPLTELGDARFRLVARRPDLGSREISGVDSLNELRHCRSGRLVLRLTRPPLPHQLCEVLLRIARARPIEMQGKLSIKRSSEPVAAFRQFGEPAGEICLAGHGIALGVKCGEAHCVFVIASGAIPLGFGTSILEGLPSTLERRPMRIGFRQALRQRSADFSQINAKAKIRCRRGGFHRSLSRRSLGLCPGQRHADSLRLRLKHSDPLPGRGFPIGKNRHALLPLPHFLVKRLNPREIVSDALFDQGGNSINLMFVRPADRARLTRQQRRAQARGSLIGGCFRKRAAAPRFIKTGAQLRQIGVNLTRFRTVAPQCLRFPFAIQGDLSCFAFKLRQARAVILNCVQLRFDRR